MVILMNNNDILIDIIMMLLAGPISLMATQTITFNETIPTELIGEKDLLVQ